MVSPSALRRTIALALSGAGLLAVGAVAGGRAAETDPSGIWKRPNGDTVQVTSGGGKLMCQITNGDRSGFEMCNGMSGGGNAWRGTAMKHPDMPGFMSFNGTVAVAGTTLSIKGCAIGQSMCDSETWSRVR